jgi:hypothetical protein
MLNLQEHASNWSAERTIMFIYLPRHWEESAGTLQREGSINAKVTLNPPPPSPGDVLGDNGEFTSIHKQTALLLATSPIALQHASEGAAASPITNGTHGANWLNWMLQSAGGDIVSTHLTIYLSLQHTVNATTQKATSLTAVAAVVPNLRILQNANNI